jgi:hypothetical protein
MQRPQDTVLSGVAEQVPLALQVASQMPPAPQSLLGSVPAATGAHAPSESGMSQRWHLGHDETPQHTWSTQFLLLHSLEASQYEPVGRRLPHTPRLVPTLPTQFTPAAQSLLLVQLVLHVACEVELQAYPAVQLCTLQLPPPSHSLMTEPGDGHAGPEAAQSVPAAMGVSVLPNPAWPQVLADAVTHRPNAAQRFMVMSPYWAQSLFSVTQLMGPQAASSDGMALQWPPPSHSLHCPPLSQEVDAEG